MRVACSALSLLAASLALLSMVNALPQDPAITARPKLLPRATSTAAVTHTVTVGAKISPHAFVPSNITANPGDTVLFEFYPTNHSVAKADYLAPCVPASSGEFWSGSFNDFDEDGNGQLIGDPPTWSLLVNDTEPTFFYCTAIGSCLQNGMVGVINQNSSQTFESQYKAALNYPVMTVPGQSFPAEGSDSEGDGTNTSTSPSSGHHGLSGGAIAGIVIAIVAFLAILGALFFVLGRNRVYQKWMTSQDNRTERTTDWAMSTAGSTNHWNRKSETEAASTALGSPPLETGQWGEFPQEQRFSEAPDTSMSAPRSQQQRLSGGYEGSISRNKTPTELPAYDPPAQYPDRY
ncbi:hypothetical protein N7468_000250 [Penicillium chermesinum]|uniref:Extracellular serine-rich protein n=1 Tax=Penicillium chermesinum TaxID=63820 RepID=A0A9W9PMY4_9EURO|nr:uncharacterized protein N7468_000250 [Penicillium chermesinum]KAJ5248799.1 hypothetical protein N7468_000250 [Penicillium chermesinum]KAJ6150902.1 hypothetical protein N7470_007496 [Penicillium chermesinum]